MKHLKKYHIEDSAYETLENVYFEAREARNFQTHDLWRIDIQGVVNTVYLLGYDCPEVLSSLLKPTSFNQNSLEAHVIQPETNLRLAQFVIQSGGNVHHADHVQMRPLHYAAESGFMKMAQLLIDKGAVVDAHSRSGTPTEIAQSHGRTELAQFLSNQRGIRRSSNAKAPLDAVNSLDIERVQVLVSESYYDPLADFDGSLPLVALFEKEDIDFQLQIKIANILFQAVADVNQQDPASGQSVLHVAATLHG
ncbi:MAG: ankyrin repeat domain-containing protein [Chlamydiia bacterium]|nr:ankyrin repeat domain-containing protein [Chlamydiia bacterium]